MKQILSTFALLLAVTLTASGQDAGRPQPPTPMDVLVQFLNLSDGQAAQVRRSLQELQTTASEIQSRMQSRQRELASLLSASSPDEAAVGRLIIEIRSLERSFQAALERYHAAFIAVLQPEQMERVTRVAQARELLPMVAVFASLNLVEPPANPRPDMH